ncbi:hypothetical protein [Pantoea sp.]|uniref:hypothetical protein n=1 Tax=Pantoea sp. TaxID=69393 RepID=UPI0031DFF8F9
MNIKLISRKLKIVVLAVVLSGCTVPSPLTENNQNCSPHAGFSNGVNDAMMGNPLNANIGADCPPGQLNALRKSYQEGYLQWYEKPNGEINTHKKPKPNMGIIVASINAIKKPQKKNNEKYYCEVKAFGKKYYSFGRTELDARIKTQLFCQEGNGDNSIFCRDDKISCQLNK